MTRGASSQQFATRDSQLTIRVTAYDNGMVEVDGIPINVEPTYDQGQGWLGAVDVITTTLQEFRKDSEKRKAEKRRPRS